MSKQVGKKANLLPLFESFSFYRPSPRAYHVRKWLKRAPFYLVTSIKGNILQKLALCRNSNGKNVEVASDKKQGSMGVGVYRVLDIPLMLLHSDA